MGGLLEGWVGEQWIMPTVAERREEEREKSRKERWSKIMTNTEKGAEEPRAGVWRAELEKGNEDLRVRHRQAARRGRKMQVLESDEEETWEK